MMLRLPAAVLSLALLLRLCPGAAAPRCATWWLEPYSNLTSVSAYVDAWSGLAAAGRGRCYVAAGSAYALKHNGSLGYADTPAGEGNDGVLMERYGFPALRQLNITAITALVYITHSDGIAAMLAQPQPFIDALLAVAEREQLAGFDLDYEPQGAPSRTEAAAFMAFLSSLAAQMAARGLARLTIDIGGCPTFYSFDCAGALANVSAANTMDAFNVRGVADMPALVRTDGAQLGARWAPGFEPASVGEAQFSAIMAWLATPAACAQQGACPRSIASWAAREYNTGPQPAWLWQAVNTFLDAP
jgi:hypothetical protein